ncbi:MAG: prolipoprotein diacylglyceryl transferase [Bacteroidales bacterium]|nr:prolipoprotein diacylglyceryl transferase [Bacteroidales bacterium]
MFLNYIIWNVNPEIISLGPLSVRWYGLLFALAFVAGYIIVGDMFKREGIPIKLLDRLTTYMVIGTVAGARLGHCFFYEPGYYLSNPLKILEIWEGGLASHGAAIGIVISLYYFAKRNRKSLLWTLDRIVIVVALSGLFIRTGNLMNSEIYGVETSLPWGFMFVRAGETTAKHPTQIYEGLSYFIIFLILYVVYLKGWQKIKEGMLFGWFLTLLFSVRFLIEFVKEPQVGFEAGMALNMGQLLSIPFVLAGVYFLLRRNQSKPKQTPRS